MRRCLFEMHGLSNWNSVYLSSFEKTPHKENAMPVTNKIIPVISTGNKLISDTVCQYLPNSVFHSVVFSIFMLAIKEVHSTINVPVSSNPVPAIIFFILRPPHLSICSLYPPRFSSFKTSCLQQRREQAQHACGDRPQPWNAPQPCVVNSAADIDRFEDILLDRRYDRAVVEAGRTLKMQEERGNPY